MEWIIFLIGVMLIPVLYGIGVPIWEKFDKWIWNNPEKSDKMFKVLCIPFIPIFLLAIPILWVMIQSENFARKIIH